MTEITTKLFGSSVYTKEDGVDFDDQELVMNNITSLCTAMIFEDLDETGLREEGSPFTDQILAASFNKDGKFLSIAHES